MDDELGKIDLIRSRAGVSYKRAKEALDGSGGDVIQALIFLEDEDRDTDVDGQNKAHEILDQFKSIFHKGQETKIKVKKGEKTVFEFPATLGALGVLGALSSSQLAILGALGTMTAMAKSYTLEIEHLDDNNPGEENKENPDVH